MSTVRLRRLRADHEKLVDYARRHPRVKVVSADGDPPERFQIEYGIRSLRRVNDELVDVNSHLVEIVLPGHYPRLPPLCRMLTPIFHPNIAPHAICIGDHWSAGEPLWSLVARIGEMIAYQSYNVKSPLNGEAARWVADNLERLPLDPVSLLVEEERRPPPNAEPPAAAPRPHAVARAVAPAQDASLMLVCPGCQTRLLFSPLLAGKRARCAKCQTIISVPA